MAEPGRCAFELLAWGQSGTALARESEDDKGVNKPPRFLAGKAALVTGSTSGIGLAVIKALAGAGADVALNGIASSQEVQRLRDQIAAETGVKVVYADADLRKPAQIRDAVKRVADELGRLDIVHNNAGRSTPTPGEHSHYHPHSQPHLPSHSQSH
ncbi:uncharacterized protein HaLaN_01928 [Haematococcus lacustris]|uniref:Uncharacterized protein n=1 Tax=Haematococcus lacustris TaxID=44745 RepID=A0A699YAG1_HAELA|nr:uncharacterized protein HaLaN_01928 [Haematococcus lacustris]